MKMPNNWKTYKISDIFKLRKETIPVKDFSDQNYIGLEHITQGTFLLSGIGKAKDVSSNKYIFESGDILYGKIRPYFKKVYQVDFSGICSTDILVLRSVNEDKLAQDYLYQVAKTQEFTNRAIETSSGTKMPRADWNSMEKVEMLIPTLPEQRAIASILSTIDDKIENNLAMNKILEEMAMALYKHWFVHFGPFQEGKFVESELGDIPEGWEVKPIGDIIETIGGGTPSTKKEEYWKDGDIHWYSPTDLTKSDALFSIEPAKRITELGLKKSSAKLFPAKSLLMSSRATIGALSINLKEATTNQGFITMIPNEKLSVFQLYGWAKYNMDLIISKANGSTFKEISKTNFRAIPILLTKNIESYESRASEIFGLIENNIKENQTLIEQRDAMLPKLVSGEVRVKGFS